MGAAVEGAALAVVGFTTQIANGLDKLYWASQRTGATVNGIKALGYAASQTGASAEAAQNSLEVLRRFCETTRGRRGFLTAWVCRRVTPAASYAIRPPFLPEWGSG